MTTPTASLTTAAEMAREFAKRYVDKKSAAHPEVLRSIADFLTAFAEQVRREAIEDCAKICDGVYQDQPHPIHRSPQVCAFSIRALAPSPQAASPKVTT